MDANPVTGVYRRELAHTHTQRKPHVTTEDEAGLTQLQAVEHQGLPAIARRQEEAGKDSSLAP